MLLFALACTGPHEPRSTTSSGPDVPVDTGSEPEAPLTRPLATLERRTPAEWATTTWGSCRDLVDPRPIRTLDDVREAVATYTGLGAWSLFSSVLAETDPGLGGSSDGPCPRVASTQSGSDYSTRWSGPCRTAEGISWAGWAEAGTNYSSGYGYQGYRGLTATGETPALASLSFYLDGLVADAGDWTTFDTTEIFHAGLLRVTADLDTLAEPLLDGEFVRVHRASRDQTYLYVVDGAGVLKEGDFCVLGSDTFIGSNVARLVSDGDGAWTVFIDGAEVGTLSPDDLASE